jgi:hypothetical protein
MKNNYQQVTLCVLSIFSLMGTITAQQIQKIRIDTDSVLNTHIKQSNASEPLQSQEISKEVDMPKNGEVYIQSNYRSIQVKTWDQQKVKLTTTFFYSGEKINFTDEELMTKLDEAMISLRTVGSSVKIKTNFGDYGNNTPRFGSVYALSKDTASTQGRPIRVISPGNRKRDSKNDIIIYIPSGIKVDIENKYCNVKLANSMPDASIDITNGNLETEDIDKLVLRSKYSSVSLGNIKNAEVEFTNGRFTAKNIDEFDIDSKYSSIELATVKTLRMKSTDDEYEVEEMGALRGRKNYGNLRITHLKGLLELEGQNADLKIKDVATSVNHIKIDDKYADIRIPLRNIKSYSIDFSGAYSTVYGDFEKKPVEEKATTAGNDNKTSTGDLKEKVVTGYQKASSGYATSSSKSQQMTLALTQVSILGGNDTPAKFTAAVGDGKGIKVDMKCQNCTVDFK